MGRVGAAVSQAEPCFGTTTRALTAVNTFSPALTGFPPNVAHIHRCSRIFATDDHGAATGSLLLEVTSAIPELRMFECEGNRS
jgi:hypothetical protein